VGSVASKDFATDIRNVTHWPQSLYLAQDIKSLKEEQKGNTTYLFLHQ